MKPSTGTPAETFAEEVNTHIRESSQPRLSKPRYLGDAVYVQMEYGRCCLYTDDGVSVTNRVVLEPETYEALLAWMEEEGWG